jgi:hypothetical protein
MDAYVKISACRTPVMLAGAPPLEAQFFPCFIFDLEIKDWSKGKGKNKKATKKLLRPNKTVLPLPKLHGP